ncbi:MAG TPA: DUF2007 domain-containing protein [Thermoanaerobaculia bacterium]|jgi:tRNA-dihydrouridine synthase|nr:DUF2007 domain-containing protein [Thermoanaerobaculia bacterium]
MFCPECRSEYREGFVECADCRVPLVESLAAEATFQEINLVTVLASADPAVLALAESLLAEAEIPYLNQGEPLQNVFAGTVGPVLLQVPEEHAEAALELLAELESTGEEDAADRLEEPERK